MSFKEQELGAEGWIYSIWLETPPVLVLLVWGEAEVVLHFSTQVVQCTKPTGRETVP